MTKLINALFFSFLFCLPASAGPADTVHRHGIDTLTVRSRSFDEKRLTEFKNDSDFQYGRPQEGLTLWDRFLIWFFTTLSRILRYFTRTLPGQILFYGFWSLIILYVVLKLLNIDVKDLFFRSAGYRKVNFKLAEENIHELDFEKLINEATANKRYRDAVRLVFLHALKKLSDAQLIQWTPGKTNDEYLLELAQHPARTQLQELRYYFDYAWYGHFEVSDQTFAGVRKIFTRFNENLS